MPQIQIIHRLPEFKTSEVMLDTCNMTAAVERMHDLIENFVQSKGQYHEMLVKGKVVDWEEEYDKRQSSFYRKQQKQWEEDRAMTRQINEASRHGNLYKANQLRECYRAMKKARAAKDKAERRA